MDEWFKTSDHENDKDGLVAWLELVDQLENQTFKKIVKTFTRWKKEILHSFMYSYNNGYIEGGNNTTKVIKRMSYGIKALKDYEKNSVATSGSKPCELIRMVSKEKELEIFSPQQLTESRHFIHFHRLQWCPVSIITMAKP